MTSTIHFNLISFALGADVFVSPHHRAGYPEMKGKDKHNTIV
jgi:hypothetical protein